MAVVTDVLKTILISQGLRTITGQEAMRRILTEVGKHVVGEIVSAATDSFTSYMQRQLMGQIERLLFDAEAGMKVEVSRGIRESWEEGVGMLPRLAQTGSAVTLNGFGISTHVVDQIKEFAWGKISGLRNEAAAKIRSEITLGLLGQQSPQDVAASIAGTLEKPGIFKGLAERAEVITKTEMGRTFSMAAQASFDNASETLPEMQKMWLHAGHPKNPRPYHLRLNGDIKPVDEAFLVGNISMMFPRDPTAPVSEIINCGCMCVPYMAEWGTKKEFLKSWDQAQKAANKKQ